MGYQLSDLMQALETRLYEWAIANGYAEPDARRKAHEAALELQSDYGGEKIPALRVNDDPEICARAYELHVLQQIPASDVARRTGITRRTVYRRVQRHLARIRSESELPRVTA